MRFEPYFTDEETEVDISQLVTGKIKNSRQSGSIVCILEHCVYFSLNLKLNNLLN